MKEYVDRRLRESGDEAYKDFNRRIVPTGYEVVGVRMPALRALAKELAAHPDVGEWLDMGEVATYEHVLLRGLVMARMPWDGRWERLDRLIGEFDNWAHVDTVISSFKVFARHREEVLEHFLPLKNDEGEFTKRVFVVVLMDFFMDDEWIDRTLEHLAGVPQGQYYVDMALAWAISVALVKHYDRAVRLLYERRMGVWVHNKAIQKACESFRIGPERKERLRRMKR